MGVRHLAPQEAKFWLFFGPPAQPRKNAPPTATHARVARSVVMNGETRMPSTWLPTRMPMLQRSAQTLPMMQLQSCADHYGLAGLKARASIAIPGLAAPHLRKNTSPASEKERACERERESARERERDGARDCGAAVERQCKMTNFVAGAPGRFFQGSLNARNKMTNFVAGAHDNLFHDVLLAMLANRTRARFARRGRRRRHREM